MATAGLYQEELPFNSFLIPRNASSLPVFKRKKILNRWQRFQLWFNTYRYRYHHHCICRKLTPTSKFFTFVVILNFIGIVLASLNVWQYPRKYTGALVLGNLLTAILMRNELFGRFLYLIVNTCFAKVSPRRVLAPYFSYPTVDAAMVPLRLHVRPAAPRGHSLWMRLVRGSLATLQNDYDIHKSCEQPRCCPRGGDSHQPRCVYIYHQCIPVGSKHTPQVCTV